MAYYSAMREQEAAVIHWALAHTSGRPNCHPQTHHTQGCGGPFTTTDDIVSCLSCQQFEARAGQGAGSVTTSTWSPAGGANDQTISRSAAPQARVMRSRWYTGGQWLAEVVRRPRLLLWWCSSIKGYVRGPWNSSPQVHYLPSSSHSLLKSASRLFYIHVFILPSRRCSPSPA